MSATLVAPAFPATARADVVGKGSPLAGDKPPRSSRDANATRSRGPIEGTLEFELPAALEAVEPPEARGVPRDQVRLLVTERSTGRVVHTRFDQLPELLAPGDLVVANDSATIPAALDAWLPDGPQVALHLSTRIADGIWVVEPRNAEVRRGEVLALPGGGTATLLARHAGSERLWLASLDVPLPVLEYLAAYGRPIAYPYVKRRWPLAAYQTVYARDPGSAEMPSAGRPFSHVVLARFRQRGVGFATITLHCGVASLEAHEPPYAEPYRVPAETAEAANAARAHGRRVVAVGTTVVRALETAADTDGRVLPSQGWTELVVTPERGVRSVDALLTGFHEPKASHLAMLEAVAGRAHLELAYSEALRERYLWHEFGDVHLIL